MTQKTRDTIRKAAQIAAFLVPMGAAGRWGYGISSKIDSIGAKADTSSVNQLRRDFLTAVDGLSVKVDSANLRLRQIQCGKRVDEGCR